MSQIELFYNLDPALSKNRKTSFARGRYYTNPAHKDACNALIMALKAQNKGQVWKKERVWIDIFLMKSKERQDVSNFVDVCCDAVKQVILVDDCFFSIKADWEMCIKGREQLVLTITQ